MNRKRRLDSPTTSAQEAAPNTKDQHKDDRTGDPLLEVEIVDISIDGMCGVY
ncbi:electron carrier mycofactocin [Ferrithrix thermotolerans]|uniref:electron carrier mycofactocin n=1 Tax=Ferrithrix thermotolerans TaxID=209649 RepID=UPI0015C1B0E1|nr:electron carrier mycofactocin [Ferrithrix thermotolerans]